MRRIVVDPSFKTESVLGIWLDRTKPTCHFVQIGRDCYHLAVGNTNEHSSVWGIWISFGVIVNPPREVAIDLLDVIWPGHGRTSNQYVTRCSVAGQPAEADEVVLTEHSARHERI